MKDGKPDHQHYQLQTAAEISRAASSILDLRELMSKSVELIKDRFELYYTGIFLLDPSKEYAVLKAGTGQAGKQQIENKHQLAVGGNSMIGQTIAMGTAQISQNIEEASGRFSNPYLPDTRSEMALPLISRGQTIGAMTIQSVNENAFSPEDITTLQTMADQLANAIENARLYEEAQRLLTSERRQRARLSRQTELLTALAGRLDEAEICEIMVRKAGDVVQPDQISLYEWDSLQNSFRVMIREIDGEEYDTYIIGDLISTGDRPDLWETLENTRPVLTVHQTDPYTQEHFLAPWYIGDEIVGVIELYHTALDLHFREEDQVEILAIIRQTALALQSARIYRDTQYALARTEALFNLSQAATASEDLLKLLHNIVKNIADFFHSQNASITLFDLDTEKVTQFVRSTDKASDIPALSFKELMTTPVGQVVKKGKPLLSTSEKLKENQDHKQLIIPIIYRGKISGIVTVNRSAEEPNFQPHDIELLTAMTGVIAATIENARNIELTQRHAEEERTLNQIGSKLSGTLDFDSVLKIAIQELGQMPEVAEVAIHISEHPEK